MSHGTSLADYRAALTTPGAGGPALAAMLARLPIAMTSIAVLIYVQRSTGSYAAAGAVSASMLVGVASGAVAQGRVIDRLGPTRPLLVIAAALTAATTVLVLAIEARASLPVLVALALLVGATEPAVSSASRALWGRLIAPGPARQAAYTYEAISLEVFFILGPSLGGLLAAAPWAGTGLVVAAGSMAVGAVIFALTPAVRGWRAVPRERGVSILGALAAPGMRTLILVAGGFGLTTGFVEVAVPASATLAGHPAVGGLLLGAWSVTSVLFGVLYGMRPWPRPLHLRAPALLGGFALLVALMAIPTSLAGLAVAMLAAGALITPQSTTHSAVIDQVAAGRNAAEAFGWVITAVTLGLATGQSLSGVIVETAGPRWAFLAATGCGLLVAWAVWLRRHTLQPAPDTPMRASVAIVGH